MSKQVKMVPSQGSLGKDIMLMQQLWLTKTRMGSEVLKKR